MDRNTIYTEAPAVFQKACQRTFVTPFAMGLATLLMARQLHPGQKNNLDALCKRYFIDNSQRSLHGALLDAEILADVYLAMTGGQTSFMFDDETASNNAGNKDSKLLIDSNRERALVITANEEEIAAHLKWLDLMSREAVDGCVWRELEAEK